MNVTMYTPGVVGYGYNSKWTRRPSFMASSAKTEEGPSATLAAGVMEVRSPARTRTTIPIPVSNRTFPTIRRTAWVGSGSSTVRGMRRYRLKAPRPTIGAKSAIFARTTHPYGVPNSASTVPTRRIDNPMPPARTRPTAYAAIREKRPKTMRAKGAASDSRKNVRTATIPARPPSQRPIPAKCAAFATTPSASMAGRPGPAAAAWVPRLPTTIPATARRVEAWVDHADASGFPPRDCAKARESKANMTMPKARRAVTDWTYGDAERPWAAEVPSRPVTRTKRPTMDAAKTKAAIRPTLRRTGNPTL